MVLYRNIKTSKKNSSHRCAGSWVLCQEMWPSITGQPGMSQGHTGLMLCALITVMPTFRKVNDVVCRSALNAVPEFYAGKGRAEKGASLGSSRAAQTGETGFSCKKSPSQYLLVCPGYPHVPAALL